MKFYRTKAYRISDKGKAEFIGDVVVEKAMSIPILGTSEVKDTASKFPYALLERDEKENIIGPRENLIKQAGFDIGIYTLDLTEENMVGPDKVVEYNEIFPIAKISALQDELKYVVDDNSKMSSTTKK